MTQKMSECELSMQFVITFLHEKRCNDVREAFEIEIFPLPEDGK
jgi:hypothetical protein